MNVLTVNNLKKSFGRKEVLHGVSFAIEKGEIFGYLGPNGAGKSTTIHAIMDFIRPTDGTISIWSQDAQEQSVPLKKRIGYVPSEPTVYTDWSVADHLNFINDMHGHAAYKRARDLQTLLGLENARRVRQLSTGNQQKLAIVLALASKPELLVLDEPTRGLDPLLRATFHSLLRKYRDDGGTVFLSSHDLSEVSELCDRVAIIHEGKIVQDTTVNDLRVKHGHTVHLTLSKPIPELKTVPGVTNVMVNGHSFQCVVKGDINPFLKAIASKGVVEGIEISTTSLEDIFMEIYQ